MLTGKRLLLAGVGAALAVFLVAGAAFAQATPTPAAADGTRTSYGQYFLDRLAAALNISREELNAAGKTAAAETIEKQLQDGRLNQAQADSARQRLEQSEDFFPWFGGKGHGMGERGLPSRLPTMFGGNAHAEGVAKALNISVEELNTQLRTGKSVADLAAEKNVSADTVKASVVTAVTAQLDQAVNDGKLTAEQAANAKNQLNNVPADQFLQMGGKVQRGMPFGGRGDMPRPGAPRSGTPTAGTSA